MKAAVYREHNKDPRKVVKIEDIEIPKIKCNKVLIKVEAVSYNYNDLWGIWVCVCVCLFLTFLKVMFREH